MFHLSIPRGKSGETGYLFTLLRKEDQCINGDKQLLALFNKRKSSPLTKEELKEHWKSQEKKRKESNVIPSGHIDGKSKPLIVDGKSKPKRVSMKSGTCPRDVKRILPAMMDRFLLGLNHNKMHPKTEVLNRITVPPVH